MSNSLLPTPYKAVPLEAARAANIMFNDTKIGVVVHMDKQTTLELVKWLNDAYQAGITHTINTLEAVKA